MAKPIEKQSLIYRLLWNLRISFNRPFQGMEMLDYDENQFRHVWITMNTTPVHCSFNQSRLVFSLYSSWLKHTCSTFTLLNGIRNNFKDWWFQSQLATPKALPQGINCIRKYLFNELLHFSHIQFLFNCMYVIWASTWMEWMRILNLHGIRINRKNFSGEKNNKTNRRFFCIETIGMECNAF